MFGNENFYSLKQFEVILDQCERKNLIVMLYFFSVWCINSIRASSRKEINRTSNKSNS